MVNRKLLAIGILIIVIGLVQWIAITKFPVILNPRLASNPGEYLVQQSVDPGTTVNVDLGAGGTRTPIREALYIPILAYPKFYVIMALQGTGGTDITGSGGVDQVNITINFITDGQVSYTQSVSAADHVISIDVTTNSVTLYIETVDILGVTEYSLTIKNDEGTTITAYVSEFGVKTDTTNTMLLLGFIGIITIVASVVLKAGPSKKRKRKAFYALEEEPTLAVSSAPGATSKKVKKKKKKPSKKTKKARKPTTPAAGSTCQYCGQSIPPNSFFCPHCYAELR